MALGVQYIQEEGLKYDIVKIARISNGLGGKSGLFLVQPRNLRV